MATLLYRLGRFAYRRPWRIIVSWLVLLLAILGGGIALGGQSEESYVIPGTESQEALDLLDAVFPAVAGAGAEVIYVAPEGEAVTDPEHRATITTMARAIDRIDGVDSVTTPFSEFAGNAVTDDERMALTRVQFTGVMAEVSEETLEELAATASVAEEKGLRVEFGGAVFQDTTVGITVTEVFGVVFAAVVLIITFGSLLAAGMPLLSALIGVGIVVGGITVVSAFTTVSSSAPLLALMIGLAVGIDYALFILSRHRNQLAAGEDPEESAAIAVGTAGSAVVFAGVTVIIALLGLLVVGIPFLSVMGVGAAFAVLVAMGVATTLLPALMGLARTKLKPKSGSRAHRIATAGTANTGAGERRHSMGMRWVKGATRYPLATCLVVIGILGTLAIPALDLELSLPDNGSEPAGSTQREAYDLVTSGFGPGYNGPLIVAVDITQTLDIIEDLDAIGDELRGLDGVEWVSQGLPNEGLDTAIIQVVPSSAPDAGATKELVQSIRDLAPGIESRYDTAVAVTGTTAVGIDISNRLAGALVPFGVIVVGLSIVLLMMVFRSVLIPIKAALGFLLSVVASFGVTVAVFQWGWFGDLVQLEDAGPILSFMPILLMAVLFGLAMDYEVFLVSGMREEYVHSGDAERALSVGFARAARVVTAAALIMFFVFFAFVPEGSGMIKPIALGLATGIALDAFLVRMTLVPAVIALMGKAAWWMPAWLDRLLPNLDVEGDRLRQHRADVEWAREQHGAAISADGLRVGAMANDTIGPITLAIPPGALALAHGPQPLRGLLAATLAGRLEPRAGRAQVAGHPLPSESAQVAKRVAMVSVAGHQSGEPDATFGDLLHERLMLTLPWHKTRHSRREADRWVARVNRALGAADAVTPASNLQHLPQLARAVALAAAGIAERPRAVMIDLQEAFPNAEREAAFIRAVCELAPSTTTVILGIAFPLHDVVAVAQGHRPVFLLDLGKFAGQTAVTESALTEAALTEGGLG